MPDEHANRALHDSLLALELRLLDPATRKQPAAVASLLAPEFREFGRSGRVCTKQNILDHLAAEESSAVELRGFTVTPVDATAALATFVSLHATGSARRSSLWVWREGCWLLLFHQGTPIP